MAEHNETGAMLVSHDPALPPEPVVPPEPPATAPPLVVTAPYAWQLVDLLNVTMGTWENMSPEPHSYAYQWYADSVAVGLDQPTCPVDAAAAGAQYVCVVTATNELGEASSASNIVTVTAP